MNTIWQTVPATRSDVRRLLGLVRDGKPFDADLPARLMTAIATATASQATDADLPELARTVLSNRHLVQSIVRILNSAGEG